MCSIEKINRAIEKSMINRPIVELSRRAGSTGQLSNYREEQDQQANCRTIEKSKINRAIDKSRINRAIDEHAHTHTHNEIDKTIVNAHSTTPLNMMISV
jgi:hypothetical protein